VGLNSRYETRVKGILDPRIAARRSRGPPPKFNGMQDNLAIYLRQSSEASMSTLTPNELTYPVTPPAIDAAAGPAVVIAGGAPPSEDVAVLAVVLR
jgi:hypothetical protein